MQHYHAALQAAGHDPAAVQIAADPIWIHLARTREQAWDEAEEAMHWTFEFYRRYSGDKAIQRILNLPVLLPVGELRHAPIGRSMIVGTTDDALAFLEQFRDCGLQQIPFDFHHPGQPSREVRRSMELFAEKIIPVLKMF